MRKRQVGGQPGDRNNEAYRGGYAGNGRLMHRHLETRDDIKISVEVRRRRGSRREGSERRRLEGVRCLALFRPQEPFFDAEEIAELSEERASGLLTHN